LPRLEQWLASGPLIADGAWGTEMQKLGLPLGECPDPWNLSHPDRVASVARAYVEAGSRVVLTNTFRANRLSLGGAPLEVINRAGVAISKGAAGTRALVFASIGPSGKRLGRGEVTRRELENAFAEQADWLASAGADALVLETMTDLEEARIALGAALRNGLPVVVSFSFHGPIAGPSGTGLGPEQVARRMQQDGAAAVGANCGTGVEGLLDICHGLRAGCSLPLWIKPSAGLPDVSPGELSYRMTGEEFAAHFPALIQAGAGFLGGCCGTTPAFIRLLARSIAATARAVPPDTHGFG
jgi:5-methyltetrahydrofolate--homocysteine methyltransferase